jgi:hypothetical protein
VDRNNVKIGHFVINLDSISVKSVNAIRYLIPID